MFSVNTITNCVRKAKTFESNLLSSQKNTIKINLKISKNVQLSFNVYKTLI